MWTLAVVVTLALVPCVTSQYQVATPTKWHVNNYPDPWWFPEDCNRDNKSAICDPNAIISKQEAGEIDRLIEAVALDTRCPCYHCVTNQRGYVIRVALMEEMEALRNDSDTIMGKLRNVRLFAYLLTQRWKLTGNCNETILIVYSLKDHVLYTMTGDQASNKLKDDIVVEISIDVRPYFNNRETIAEGLKQMIKKYRDVFKNKYEREPTSGGDYDYNGHGSAAISTCSLTLLLLSIVALLKL